MTNAPPKANKSLPSPSLWPWWVSVLAGIAVLVGVVLIVVLGLRQQQGANQALQLDRALSDIIQVEVESQALQLSIDTAIELPENPTALRNLRRDFDVLFSHLSLLENSAVTAPLMSAPENRALVARMRAYLDAWEPLIDGNNARLTAALPRIEREVITLHGLSHDLGRSAQRHIDALMQARRDHIARLVSWLGLVAVALVLLLGLLAVMLTRGYRAERANAHENLALRTRLELIIANSPEAIVVTNRGGWTVEFNPAAEVMFGLPREAVLNRQAVPLLFAPQDVPAYQAQISTAIAQAISRGAQRFELQGRRADGTSFPLEVSLASRAIGQGTLIVAFMRDISARKTAETLLREALEKARAGEKAKADFVAVMSHEIRTPLNGLLGAVNLLQDTTLTPDQTRLTDVIASTGQVLLDQVNSVLDIAQGEAGQFRSVVRPFDLDRLITECIENQRGLALQNKTAIQHHPLSGALSQVEGDPNRLRQILLNLIGNAVKFTHNGTITVETERHDPKAFGGTSDIVEFRIIDTGPGIAEQDQKRIFDDFEMVEADQPRQTKGTGLGLGIVRKLARAMGGETGLESELGIGSVFWVRLPLRPVAAPPALDPPPTPLPPASAKAPDAAPDTAGPAPAPSAGRKILVIEDNDINRFILRRILEEDGHQIIETRDGIEGLAAAEAQSFDVILTDISMPRMDGVETARRIRAGSGPCAKTPIIALTAHALPADIDRFLAAGIDACLTKPVNRDKLAALLAQPAAASAPPQNALPLLDSKTLADLHQTLGNLPLTSLIDRLTTEATTVTAALATAQMPPEQMAQQAHQLAGGCATFGVLRLRAVLSGVETDIKTGNVDAARAAAATLPALWGQTSDALQTELRRLAAPQQPPSA